MAELRSQLVRHLLLARAGGAAGRAVRRAGDRGRAGRRRARGLLRPLPAAGGAGLPGAALHPRLGLPARLGGGGDPRRHGAADPGLHDPHRPPRASARRGAAGAGCRGSAPTSSTSSAAWRRCARTGSRARAGGRSIAAAGESYRRETMATLRVGFLSALVLELLAMIGIALVAATVGIQLAEGKLGLTAGPDRADPGAGAVPAAAPARRPVPRQRRRDGEPPSGSSRCSTSRPRSASPRGLAAGARTPAARRWSSRAVASPTPAARRCCAASTWCSSPGETVALVGPSGGGKTTLLSLLLRLADPSGGSISCGGVDLRDVDPAAWRAAGRLGAAAADDLRRHRRRQRAARRARTPPTGACWRAAAAKPACSRSSLDLPERLETRIGEGGRRLSAGQAQRVGAGPRLPRDAPLLLLDEPTAHLDEETERGVVAAIERLAAERTALLVAHARAGRAAPTACSSCATASSASARRRAPRRWRHERGDLSARAALTTAKRGGAAAGGRRDPLAPRPARALGRARGGRGAGRGRAADDLRLPDQPRRAAAGDPRPLGRDRRRPLLRDLAGAAALRRTARLPRPRLPHPDRPAQPASSPAWCRWRRPGSPTSARASC